MLADSYGRRFGQTVQESALGQPGRIDGMVPIHRFRVLRAKRGGGAFEYVLILCLISVLCIVALILLTGKAGA